MNIIKPKSLRTGDTIAIIAPSGVVDSGKIYKSAAFFEAKGFNVKLGKHLFENDRYLAGDDNSRLEDLHWAFSDNEVDAVVAARGGFGAIRLINKIDYNLIRTNPKIFCGYSDVTALSLMFYKKSGLITYSGAMAQSDFGLNKINSDTEKSFFNILSGEREIYSSKKIINPGSSNGIIWGGNLSTIVSLCGMDFLPDEKFIFIVEDVAEPVYKLDKMFRQLMNIGKFRENVSAIAFGEFIHTDNEPWLASLLDEISNKLKIPSASGFKFTHGDFKQTIPVGASAEFNGNIILN